MPSVFPGALDNIASNKGNGTVSADDHPTHHNKLADAVNAVQAALGVNLQNVLKPLVEYTTDPPSPILGSQWLYRRTGASRRTAGNGRRLPHNQTRRDFALLFVRPNNRGRETSGDDLNGRHDP